jgi:cell division septation protein DedD
MARDYQRKSATRSNKSKAKGASSVPVFFAGVVIGALCMNFLPMIFDGKIPDAKAMIEAADDTDLPNLTFSFHDMLKDSEIVIPDSKQQKGNVVVKKNFSYLLQVGSFRNKPDAEGLRVQLLLLNLTATVETFGAGTGDVWHRVLVGPFANTSKTAAARAKLSQNDIDSLMVKRKL